MTLDRFWHWISQLNPLTGDADPERERRGTVVILLGSICVAAAASYGLFYLFLGAWVPFGGAATAFVGVLATLGHFRRHQRIGFAAHGIAASAYLALLGVIGGTGGLGGPAPAWLILPPMVAALIAGRGPGVTWVGAGVAALAAFVNVVVVLADR